VDDRRIETHPDLMNPDWQKYAEREAWLEVKKTRRRSKRRRIKRPALVVVIALVALISAAVTVKQLRGSGANDAIGTTHAPATPPTTAPSALPEYAAVDLTQPFRNTPAALWKEGAAGISTPTPSAVGGYSADQVASAFDQVIRAITEGRLDRKTLEGHDTTAFLAALAPNDAKLVKPILDKPDKFDASAYVTLIADGFHLLPASPRVNGRLSAQPGTDKGELLVHAEYVIGYAFDPAHPGQLQSPGDILAFIRQDENYAIRTGSQYYKADQGLLVGKGNGEWFSMACLPSKAGYLAPSYSEPAIGGPAVKDEAAIYNLDKPISAENTCGS
jgi:hypothetical protein